jgi:hypothetical protein
VFLGTPVALHRAGGEADGPSHFRKSFNFGESHIDARERAPDGCWFGYPFAYCTNIDIGSAHEDSEKKTGRSQLAWSRGRWYESARFRPPF